MDSCKYPPKLDQNMLCSKCVDDSDDADDADGVGGGGGGKVMMITTKQVAVHCKCLQIQKPS